MQVFQGDKRVSKKTLCDETRCSAYYSFDPPTPPTSISVPGFNRLGGNLTITAAGGGFRQFESSGGQIRVNPTVRVGPIDFQVNFVNPGVPSTINGNVLRAGPDVMSCAKIGMSPCYRIRVTNPGGRRGDRVESAVPLYTLLPGPPPVPQSRFPDSGFSIGGTVIIIRGENLDFVDNVTIGGTPAPFDTSFTRSKTAIAVVAPPHSAGAMNSILLFDIDNAAQGGTQVPGGGFIYRISKPTELPAPHLRIFIVGPGEDIALDDTFGTAGLIIDPDLSCTTDIDIDVDSVPSPVNAQFGLQAARVTGSLD